MRKFVSLFIIFVIFASTTLLFHELKKFMENESLRVSKEKTVVFEKKTEIFPIATSSVTDKKTSDANVSAVTADKEINGKALIQAVAVPASKPASIVSIANEPLKHISAGETENGALTNGEILRWTNYYREQNGLSPLLENSKLDGMALAKVNDMFARQYFEHVSPDGEDASDLAADAGYEYILIGENLAYGDFVDSKDLLDAWMESPGHRKNILKTQYEEIGIFVREGKYQGRKVWMAVQEFGRPASSCPLPEKTLKKQIDDGKAGLDAFSAEMNTIAENMDAYKANGNYDSYNALVPAYNDLVEKMNALVLDVRSLVAEYNRQIGAYTACVGQ
jgi:uncharacterized protein YkwD